MRSTLRVHVPYTYITRAHKSLYRRYFKSTPYLGTWTLGEVSRYATRALAYVPCTFRGRNRATLAMRRRGLAMS